MDFEKIKEDILSDVAVLAKTFISNRKEDIVNETKAFMEESEEKLKSWTEALVTGEIPKNEYELLVKTRVNLLKMKTLTQAGISLVQVDNFRQGVLDIIMKVATKAIP